MYHHEVEKNGCKITCFERNMGWGIDFGMRVSFPDWMTIDLIEKNQETVRKIAQYTANKIETLLLTDATAYFKAASDYGFKQNDKDGVWIFYGGGKSAFIRPFIYQNKIDIHPFVSFNSVNEHGFTLTPGHFSDFIITNQGYLEKSLFGYTKDFHTTHFGVASVYLLNFVENLETMLLKKEMPGDFEEFACYHYVQMSESGRHITQKIQENINEMCSLNKSKRIDTLIVNNKSVYDLIREHDVQYSFDFRGTNLLKVALALGKPTSQVEQFVKKYIDKKRVSSVLPISY